MMTFQSKYEILFPPVVQPNLVSTEIKTTDSMIFPLLGVILLVSVAGIIIYQLEQEKKKQGRSLY